MMIVRNIQTGLRHLTLNRSNTLINIIGLGLGIACCLIIFLYVYHELNYDKSPIMKGFTVHILPRPTMAGQGRIFHIYHIQPFARAFPI